MTTRQQHINKAKKRQRAINAWLIVLAILAFLWGGLQYPL